MGRLWRTIRSQLFSPSKSGPSLHLCPPSIKIPQENANRTWESSRSSIAWECLNEHYQSPTNDQVVQIRLSLIVMMLLEQMFDKLNHNKVAWMSDQDDGSRQCLQMIDQLDRDDACWGVSLIEMIFTNDQIWLRWCHTNNSAVQSWWRLKKKRSR